MDPISPAPLRSTRVKQAAADRLAKVAPFKSAFPPELLRLVVAESFDSKPTLAAWCLVSFEVRRPAPSSGASSRAPRRPPTPALTSSSCARLNLQTLRQAGPLLYSEVVCMRWAGGSSKQRRQEVSLLRRAFQLKVRLAPVVVLFEGSPSGRSLTSAVPARSQSHPKPSPRIGRSLSFDSLQHLSLSPEVFIHLLTDPDDVSKLLDRRSSGHRPLSIYTGAIFLQHPSFKDDAALAFTIVTSSLLPARVVGRLYTVYDWEALGQSDGDGGADDDAHTFFECRGAALSEYQHRVAKIVASAAARGANAPAALFYPPFVALFKEAQAARRAISTQKQAVLERLAFLAQVFDGCPRAFRLRWRRDFQADERTIDRWLAVREEKLLGMERISGWWERTITDEQLQGALARSRARRDLLQVLADAAPQRAPSPTLPLLLRYVAAPARVGGALSSRGPHVSPPAADRMHPLPLSPLACTRPRGCRGARLRRREETRCRAICAQARAHSLPVYVHRRRGRRRRARATR